MNLDSLRAGLHELADEVADADLRLRAVATSDRARRRRIALVAGATVLAVVLGSAGVAARRSGRADRLPEVATTPSSVPVTFPAGATRAVYLHDQSYTRLVSVWDATGGLRHFSTNAFPQGGPSQDTIRQNASVSPDGVHLAWISDSGLQVAQVDGPAVELVVNPVEGPGNSLDGNCATPEWTPDGRRMLINPSLREYGWITIADWSYQSAGKRIPGCQIRMNGDAMAYIGSDRLFEEHVIVENLRTGETWRMPDKSGGQSSIDIVSISPDGTRVTAQIVPERPGPGNGYRTLNADIVLDTRSGVEVGVNTAGRTIRQMLYLADGNLVARVTDGDRAKLMTFDPAGRLISDVVEPAEVRGATLLRLVTP